VNTGIYFMASGSLKASTTFYSAKTKNPMQIGY